MGCAPSKKKHNNVDKNISKKKTNKRVVDNNKQELQMRTPKHYESSIDIVVPETPMSPSSQETVNIRNTTTPSSSSSSCQKENNVLNLTEALERTRRQRDAFYNSLISPPSSASSTTTSSTHSNQSNSYIDITKNTLTTTPVVTTSVLVRSNFAANLYNEEILILLNKINDCSTQHKLNQVDFLTVQNHLIGLIDTLVNFLARFKKRSLIRDSFEIEYKTIKEQIYDLNHSLQSPSFLSELSVKLETLNKNVWDFLDSFHDPDDLTKRLRMFDLISQLNEINAKLPKENFTCKCMIVNETAHELSFDDSEFNLDIDINKPPVKDIIPHLVKSIEAYGQIMTTFNEINQSNVVEKEPTPEEVEEREQEIVTSVLRLLENSSPDTTPGSTPVFTPASDYSTLPSKKTSSTSTISLEEASTPLNTSDDMNLKLDESTSKSIDQQIDLIQTIIDSNRNDIKLTTDQITEKIVDSTNVNYTDEYTNNNNNNNITTISKNHNDSSVNNISTNDNDQESEESDYVLVNKEQSNESHIQLQQTQIKTDQNKKKQNKNKKKSKRR